MTTEAAVRNRDSVTPPAEDPAMALTESIVGCAVRPGGR